jgi:hypothetical protein
MNSPASAFQRGTGPFTASSFNGAPTCGMTLEWSARDTYGTLETLREAEYKAIPDANRGAKCLGLINLAEREGFEPSVQVLARTTV